MIPRKKLDIPEKVSGRWVTNRGVHLQPFGFHGDWLNNAAYWVNLLVRMDMSWVVLITDGDAVRQTYHGLNPLKVLLDAGIIPIIREQRMFPYPFAEQNTVLWTVDLYGQYGLKPFWIIRNEPFDDREWVNRTVPDNAWDIIMNVWAQGAQFIAANGGLVGFPDGPCYDFNPFDSIKAYDCQWIFDAGLGYYTGHQYGKNRPRDYPYDAVTRYGAQLTEEAYRRQLDDFADDGNWYLEPRELLNQRRTELQSAGLTSIHDDTCWRGWEKIVHWSLASFDYVVPMAMTEGGWTPRDRAGTGPNTDIRMPMTTPRMVAKKTLQMYDTPSPYFAICPWLLADQDMGGSGWPFDAWHGWAYREQYGAKKPVIRLLERVEPVEKRPSRKPMVIDVDGDTRRWNWVREAYGVGYTRGNTNLRLVEVHEYEGPDTLDVWVVDADGLPVEGVEFYYRFPGAPQIGDGEWYNRGILRTTGPDGRISFKARGEPCAPGEGKGAIWPKGKGDVLRRLAMIAGTRNRHLNGMWQLMDDVPIIPPDQPGETGGGGGPGQPPPTRNWDMTAEYRPGPQILIGLLPEAGIQVTVADPWGNTSTVLSGSKPEHGTGAFEVLTPHPVTYTVSFLDESFGVLVHEGVTVVTFTRVSNP